MKSLKLIFALVLAITPLAETVRAQDQQPQDEPVCAAPDYPTDVRPDPRSEPTPISLGMRVFDITEINDVNQTISIDIAYRMSWVDPRLSKKAGCVLSVEDIWFPHIIMTNSGRLFKRWPESVSVGEGGKVVYGQRMSGTFSAYLDLKYFPFDYQEVELSIIPLSWGSEKVVFENNPQFTGIRYPLNISDWSIRGVKSEIGTVYLDSVDQKKTSYTLTVSADRHASYYFWKILMPIALIVVMSWCVFWINPTEFGTQLGLSASSVLTMVAFIFATTGMMPVLGYFTFMDGFIATATVFVFVALLQSLITGYVASKGRSATAIRIDHASRVMFPAAFILISIHLFYSSGIGEQPDFNILQ